MSVYILIDFQTQIIKMLFKYYQFTFSCEVCL